MVRIRALRTQVGLTIVGCALLAVSASALVFTMEAVDGVEADVEASTDRAVRATADHVAFHLESARRTVASIASALPPGPVDEERFALLVVRHDAIGRGLDAVAVVVEGNITMQRPDGTLETRLDAPLTASQGSHGITMSVVRAGDQIVGFVSWERLGLLLGDDVGRLADGSAISLRNATGHVVAGDAPDKVGASVSVTGHDLYVEVSDQDRVASALREGAIREASILGLSLGGFSLAAGLLVATTVTRPVARVQAAAQKVARGDLETRVPVAGPQEIRHLAADFNRMADALAVDRGKILRFQEELQALVDERTRDLADERDRSQHFFYGVSHEIKNPILSIVHLAEMLRRQEVAPEVAKTASLMASSSADLLRLIDQLLEYARAGLESPVVETVALDELVVAVPVPDRVEVRLDGPPMSIDCDATRLRRAIEDCIAEAGVTATDATVDVQWGHGDGACIEIGCNAPELDDAAIRTRLVPFALHATPGSGRTGIGLALAQRLVETMHGTLRLHAAGGRMTTTLEIPDSHDPDSAH